MGAGGWETRFTGTTKRWFPGPTSSLESRTHLWLVDTLPSPDPRNRGPGDGSVSTNQRCVRLSSDDVGPGNHLLVVPVKRVSHPPAPIFDATHSLVWEGFQCPSPKAL